MLWVYRAFAIFSINLNNKCILIKTFTFFFSDLRISFHLVINISKKIVTIKYELEVYPKLDLS